MNIFIAALTITSVMIFSFVMLILILEYKRVKRIREQQKHWYSKEPVWTKE